MTDYPWNEKLLARKLNAASMQLPKMPFACSEHWFVPKEIHDIVFVMGHQSYREIM